MLTVSNLIVQCKNTSYDDTEKQAERKIIQFCIHAALCCLVTTGLDITGAKSALKSTNMAIK